MSADPPLHVVFAQPDDATLAAGGLLARADRQPRHPPARGDVR